MFFFDPLYLVLMVVAMAILGGASLFVRGTYRRWSGVRNSSGLLGHQVARKILDSIGLTNVQVEIIDGELTDNYDPSSKVLRLSQGVAYNASVASEGIVAHEIGHALQDARAFAPMHIRSAIVPAANIGSQLGPLIIIGGLILMGMNALNFGFQVALIGLLLFASVTVFHLVTLPVEIDASRRAMGLLRDNGLVNDQDVQGARRVLTAAAFTYVAGLAVSVLQLAYWGMQVFSRRD